MCPYKFLLSLFMLSESVNLPTITFKNGMDWIDGFVEEFGRENNLPTFVKCVHDIDTLEPAVA